MKASQLALFFCFIASNALADTEIVNFRSEGYWDAVPLPSSWPVMSSKNPRLIETIRPVPRPTVNNWRDEVPYSVGGPCFHNSRAINPCSKDVWVILDLDWPQSVWRPGAYTLRLSLPASTPATMELTIHDPTSDPVQSYIQIPNVSLTTRNITQTSSLARIRITNDKYATGQPPGGLKRLFPVLGSVVRKLLLYWRPLPIWNDDGIVIEVVLEPLILGAIPESLLYPLSILLLVLLPTGFLAVPRIVAMFERLAIQVQHLEKQSPRKQE